MESVVNVIPCMMPYIDSQFQPRAMSDRPLVIPSGSTNFAMISQFVEIPEDMEAPAEAEKAFLETGIPVHITNDKDVLNRNKIWLRFPGDHESFDALPQKFKGIIIDLEALKIIDTKLRKIFSIHIEFSDRIKRRLGQQLLSTWEKGVLEGFVAAVCAENWKMSVTEASTRLGTRISFNS